MTQGLYLVDASSRPLTQRNRMLTQRVVRRRGSYVDAGSYADAGSYTLTQGPHDLVGFFFSEFLLYDFARLAKIDFWIVMFYILLIKISSQIVASVFPSWVFSGVFIPKNIGFSIDVIVVIFFLSIYFPLQYL